MTRLVLPWPPTINHYYGRRPRGGVYLLDKGKGYRARVWLATRKLATVTGPVALSIVAYPPDRRRRDLDNILKCLQDSLENAGVIVDDSQIDDLRIRRGPVAKGGRVVVEISSLAEGAA